MILNTYSLLVGEPLWWRDDEAMRAFAALLKIICGVGVRGPRRGEPAPVGVIVVIDFRRGGLYVGFSCVRTACDNRNNRGHA